MPAKSIGYTNLVNMCLLREAMVSYFFRYNELDTMLKTGITVTKLLQIIHHSIARRTSTLVMHRELL